MYCSTCGAEQPAPDLNYCKNCGNSLNAPTIVHSTGRGLSCGAVWGIGISTVMLVVGGMGVLAGILSDLSHYPNINGVNLAFIAIFGFATLLIAALGLLRLPFILTSSTERANKGSWLFGKKEKLQPAPLFAPANPYSQISEARTPPAGSITESTTRNLEAMYREPRS